MDSLVAPIHIPRGSRRSPRGFTMAELLVAVLLLSLSVGAMTRMWSLSRNVTGQSQNIGEAYSVARQEIERDKGIGFNVMFGSGTAVSLPRVTDYDQWGNPMGTNLANQLNVSVFGTLTLTSAPTVIPATGSTPARYTYYRAYSTYQVEYTGAETDAASALGVQTVNIWRVDGSTVNTTQPPVYQTSEFYSTAGI